MNTLTAAATLRARLSALQRRVSAHGTRRAAAPAGCELAKSATLWLPHPLGRRITCEAGTLWLTFDGDPRDVILEAGEVHLCSRASPPAIHALSPATLRIF